MFRSIKYLRKTQLPKEFHSNCLAIFSLFFIDSLLFKSECSSLDNIQISNRISNTENTSETSLESNMWTNFNNSRSKSRNQRNVDFFAELINALEQDESDLKKTDSEGNSYFHLSVINKCSYCINQLLAKSANPNVKNHAGETPLELAKRLPNSELDKKKINLIIQILEKMSIPVCKIITLNEENINSNSFNNSNLNLIEDSLRLVNEGLKELGKYDNSEDEIILVLGNNKFKNEKLIRKITSDSSKLVLASLVSFDKSGQNSTDQETPIPSLFVDSDTKTKFYSIPRFQNNFENILIQFFLKNILESAESVKFLLTTSHSSLREGKDLENLLNSVTRLIPNIEIYSKGISLVVTNVESLNSKGELIDEKDLYLRISDLLMQFKAAEFNKPEPNLASIELIDILLEKYSISGSFRNLVLTKNPTKCGPLVNSPVFLQNRQSIRHLIFNETKSVKIYQSDFSYSFPDTSENEIKNLSHATIFKIRSEFENWFTFSREKYQNNLDEIQGLQEKVRILDRHSFYVSDLRLEVSNSQNLRQTIKFLTEISFKMQLPLQPEILSLIWNLDEFLKFLVLISENDNLFINSNDWFWRNSADIFFNFFEDLNNWYSFLEETYETLSGYKIQSEKLLYQNTLTTFEPNRTLDYYNLTFLSEINGYFKVNLLQLDSKISTELNIILDHTLNLGTKYNLKSNGILTVEGNFVLISEILPSLMKINESIEIFAFDTIYIDADINISGTNRDLVIIAPKWRVQGERLFDLSRIIDNNALNISQGEKSGFLFGKSGRFFGFGETILNAKNLKITSNNEKSGMTKGIKRSSSGYPNIVKYETLFLSKYQETFLTAKTVLDMTTNVDKDNRNIVKSRINDLHIELIDIENLHSTQNLNPKFLVPLYESLILKIIKYLGFSEVSENEMRFKQLLAHLLTITSIRLYEARNYNKDEVVQVSSALQNIRADINALKDFSNDERLLKVIEIVFSVISEIETKSDKLYSSSIEQVVQGLNNSVNWYAFQIEAFKSLSSYEIQSAKQFYSLAYPEFKTEIDFSDYKLTLAGIGKVNRKRFTELSTLVGYTLKSEVRVTIENSVIQIKGNFIIVSEILQYILGQNKSVELFAFDKIYIDTDIELYEGRNLAIISPKWVIKGERYIKLNGKAGEDYKEQAAKSSSKTQSGRNGRSGKFGGDGGNFLGFGEIFENSENLHILTKGGRGGSGEKGGEGFDGKRSSQVNIKHWKGRNVPLDGNYNIIRNTDKVDYERYEKGDRIVGSRSCFSSYDSGRIVHRYYTFYGSEGYAGTSGGEGGPGGGGGNPGNIFMSFKSPPKINYITEVGPDGSPGRGGNGGRPGNIKPNKETCKLPICEGHWNIEFQDCRREYNEGIGGMDGPNGTDIIIKPSTSRLESASNMYLSLVRYKINLLENIQDDNLNIEGMLTFLNSMDSDSIRLDLFTTSDLCTELFELEKSYLARNPTQLQKIIYSNFRSKIHSYASNPNPIERSLEYKKVLAFLFTAAYSRAHGNDLRPNVITDVQSYFKILKDKIQRLRDLKNYQEKLSIINQTLTEYKEPMDKKIESGIKLIETRILPQIEFIYKELDDKMKLLIEEVIEMRKKAELLKGQLQMKEKELRLVAKTRGLFSLLKIFGQAASFLGPKGQAVGSLISGVTTITESFVLDGKTNSFQQMQAQFKGLGQFSAGLQSNINSYTNKKIDVLSIKIEKLTTATVEYPSLADLDSDINKMTKDLDSIKKARELPGANPYSYQNKVNELEEKLQSTLDQKEEELEYKKVEDLQEQQKKNRQNGAKAMRQVQNVAQLAELGVDIYHKHKNDDAAIQQVVQQIAQVSDTIKGYEKYEKQIYSYMIPQLDNMKLINERVVEGLSDLNQIELSVQKWEVQSHVKQMILKLKQFTKNSDLQEDFLHIMEELQDGLDVIVEVYDKIEEYQEQKQMLDFMALLASPASQQISITDEELSPQVSKLEYIIQANLLVSLFNHGMGSFRQWVFPFAHRYLDQFSLPRSLILKEDLNDLVNQVVGKVTKVSEIIDILKSTISTPDNDITKGIFNSQTVSQGPFYIWDYEEWKNDILDLFSGNDVIFKADLRKIPFAKNALKLSTIEINFNCSNCNETVKSRLDHELKYFSVNMTHGGNSHYKCGDKYFVVKGESRISIKQSFEFHEKKRVLVNQVSSKLALGDCQLSPYTIWTFQLFSEGRRKSFDNLKEIFNENEIHLELVGEGTYVLDGVDFSKLYLEPYYEEDAI